MLTVLQDGSEISAVLAISKIMKLREITGGFAIDDAGQAHPVCKKNPKLSELDDLLEQILSDPKEKAIIWIQYQWEAQTILARFKKSYGARGLYGGVNQKQKDINVSSFLDDPECRLLVCHPQSAGHGLTFTIAAYAIYYSLSYNFEEFYQSSKRIHRAGQTRPCFYYFLTAPQTIDEVLLHCIENKRNVQDLLVDGKLDPVRLLQSAMPSGHKKNNNS